MGVVVEADPASPLGLLVTARNAYTQRESAVELHSDIESYRKVLAFRTPEGQAATVIVMRRKSVVWLIFDGTKKTTVVMGDQDADQLIEAVSRASGNPQ